MIGEPMTATANLCYLIDQVPRLMELKLGGGALLDVGVYVLNFASLVFGNEIESITAKALMTEGGVDAQNSITLTYPGQKMAVLNSSLRVISDRKGVIYGTKGYVIVENINNFESIAVYNRDREQVAFYEQPSQIQVMNMRCWPAKKRWKRDGRNVRICLMQRPFGLWHRWMPSAKDGG